MNKRIKLMYLIPHLQNQGPVAQLLSLIRNIDQNQFAPYVVTVFPERDNSLIEQFRSLCTEVICGNAKNGK